MTNNSETKLGVIERMRSAAQREPRKALLLCAAATVLGTLSVRTLLGTGGGELMPARAGAAIAPARATSGNATEPSSSDVSVGQGQSSARSSAVEQRLRSWLAEPVRAPSRNLFTVKLDFYPVDGSRVGHGLKTAADGEFWARLEKSLMLQADQRGKRDNLVANYTAAAGKMRLDSIMMGPEPKAMIDGKLVTEGEVAAGFRVLKIEPRRIMIEREGIRLEIQMK